MGEPGALEPFEYYLARRRLRWAGHVSRVPFSRLSRMFLVLLGRSRDLSRNLSSAMATLQCLLRDLRNAGLRLKAWEPLAGDRNLWHAIAQQKNVHCNAAGVVMLG